MNSNISKIINIAKKYVGYKEKKDNKNLSSYTTNVGNNNYTIFGEILKNNTEINVQGYPWCDTFIKAIFIECFGVQATRKMLYGITAWTPQSYNNFKKNNSIREHTSPQVGDIIFFKNTERIYHTGIVVDVNGNDITTIEGNTNNNDTIITNGGEVCIKTYNKNNPNIAGYGIPDYNNPAITASNVKALQGWVRTNGTYLYYKNNTPLRDTWLDYNGLTYYLLSQGIMATGQQFIDGKRYYFDTENGHLILTNDHGGEKIYKNISIDIKKE